MSSIGSDSIRTAWDLVYRVSPIILTGGIASSLTTSLSTSGLFGSVFSAIADTGIPIAALLDPIGVLSSQSLSLDDLFAHFTPIAGGTILDFTPARQPFANQTVAANAMIQNELEVSLAMECAYRGSYTMLSRVATLAAMQATISKHVASGGRFTVITPAMIYTNALLCRITDISEDPTKPQTAFQWDFDRPLITSTEASAASATLMSKLTGGQQTSGSWVQASSGNPVAGLFGSIF